MASKGVYTSLLSNLAIMSENSVVDSQKRGDYVIDDNNRYFNKNSNPLLLDLIQEDPRLKNLDAKLLAAAIIYMESQEEDDLGDFDPNLMNQFNKFFPDSDPIKLITSINRYYTMYLNWYRQSIQ
jgi:hypothetical protein